MMMFRVRVNQSSALLPEHVKTIMASNTSTSTIDTYVNAVEATVQVVGVGGVGAVLGGLTAANAFDFATAGECRAGIRATFIAGAVIGASYALCKVVQYWHWRSTVSLSVGRCLARVSDHSHTDALHRTPRVASFAQKKI